MRPPDELLVRAERLLGSRPVAWEHRTGGYTTNERWSLDLEDGRRVFAKMAPGEPMSTAIRDEFHRMSLFDADFRCEIVAFEDADHPLLVLEDLREARWPPPWEPGDVERVLATLERVWALPTDGVPSPERLEGMFNGWQTIAADPRGFLALGIASEEWLVRCLPTLVEAERSATFEGDDFIHMDVRSDNMCFDGDRVVLVDWNWAIRGSRRFDLSGWLPSLRLEGGPLPEEIAPGLGDLAGYISGYFAKNAHLSPPPTAPHVRKFQLRQLRISLPWACRELGLPQPDRRWAMDEIAAVDAALEAGEIDEALWHVRVEEPLIDAYLSSDDPRAQSGKGGDEDDWRWARELILDVFPWRAAFLDIGCANGYLMESIHRWGAERGLEVEPYGLDISWRIAALAKLRLPDWSDRIFVGNAIDWTPPRRFDVVQAGLDEVPPPRRRELVERLLREFVVPGGKLVFRAGRVGGEYPDVVDQLNAIGYPPHGVIESAHPRAGELRRTAWLAAPVP